MRFSNFEVWIAADDIPLSEHATVYPTGLHGINSMLTYIESEAGQIFTVNWRDYGDTDMFCITIRMDGVLVEKHASPPGITGCLRGVCRGGKSMRLFTFSTNDFGLQYELGFGRGWGDEAIGTIEVTIAPIRSLKCVPACFSGPLRRADGPMSSQHMHRISVEEECVVRSGALDVHSPTISLMPTMDVDLKDEDEITFVFRYRPWMCLRTLGIVPGEEEATETGTSEERHPSTSALGKRSRSLFESDGYEPDRIKRQLGGPLTESIIEH